MTPFKFHPAAEREQDAAANWYAEESLDIAIRFLERIDSLYHRIANHPRQFPDYLQGTRRAVLDRFPFSIVFRESSDAIEIIAVAHARRKPGYWKARLKSH